MTITGRFASWCQGCIWAAHPDVLTGYCLPTARCDRCGELADLAMVRLPLAMAEDLA